MQVVEVFWEWLVAAGGTLALAFIVLLALGMNAMTVVYVGSAVVVLERFGRVVRSWYWVVFWAALVAVVAEVGVAATSRPMVSVAVVGATGVRGTAFGCRQWTSRELWRCACWRSFLPPESSATAWHGT